MRRQLRQSAYGITTLDDLFKNNTGIYSRGGKFGGFVTLAGVAKMFFTLEVDSQMFYSSGG